MVVSDVLGNATIQLTANTYMYGGSAVPAEWVQRFEPALGVVRGEPRATN